MKKYFKKTILILIFVIVFFLMFFSAKKDSATTDESVHLFAGYTYLTQNDFRIDPEHPPFIKELSALPLLFTNNIKVKLDQRWSDASDFYYDSWQESRSLSDDFLYAWGNNPEKIILIGRILPILLTLLLGYFVYFWAKKLYGEKAGIFALFLMLLCPIVLAHGRLINTDIGITLFIFTSVYFWGKYLQSPNWINLIFSGLAIGLTFSTKYTAVILLPILIILIIVKIILDYHCVFRHPECSDATIQHSKIQHDRLLHCVRSGSNNWWKYVLGFFGSAIITFIVIWASYGFSVKTPSNKIPVELSNWISNSNLDSIYSIVISKIDKLLFPADYYKGLILVMKHSLSGHGSFLLGQTSNVGWWYYFPVAIFFKSSIALFIFIGYAIRYFKTIRHKLIFNEVLLIIPPIIYLIFSMISKADLGVRHILPIFPFIFVFVSKSINAINFRTLSAKTIIFILAMIWYFIVGVGSYPNYIAYFNEFSLGSKNGYKILTDSNLDWGQDIFRIKNYITKNNLDKSGEQIYIVYPWGGEVALKYYGLNYPLLLPENKEVIGRVIISATYYNTADYSFLKKYPKKQISPGVFIIDTQKQ